MLVKVANVAVINVTAFDKVYLEQYSSREDGFTSQCYRLIFKYEDLNSKPAEHVIDLGSNWETGTKIKDEIVAQIREVEMENATTLLENAMKGKEDGEHSPSN